MRSDWTIGILDCDRTLQDGLKGLPDVETPRLAANEHRYRVEAARASRAASAAAAQPLFYFDGNLRREGGPKVALEDRSL
jgi:hypothetical protein